MDERWFKLQLTGLTVEGGHSPHIRIDVKGSNQNAATFWLQHEGSLQRAPCYVGTGPLRVRVFSKSLVLQTDLGVTTLYDHLSHTWDEHPLQGTLAFGSRLAGPLVKIAYNITPVLYRWHLKWLEVRCLRQHHSHWVGKERLHMQLGKEDSHDFGLFAPFDVSSPQSHHVVEVVGPAEAVFSVSRAWHVPGSAELGRVQLQPRDDGTLLLRADDEHELRCWGGPQQCTLTLGRCYALTLEAVREQLGRGPDDGPAAQYGPLADPFSAPSRGNHVAVLVDGLQTFERYYHALMGAQHSISILAWELSLSFGLIRVDRATATKAPHTTPAGARWISLDDVLLAKALAGVQVRVVVWRHQLLTYVNRFLYLGEVTIEAEVAKLGARGRALGVDVVRLHTGAGGSARPGSVHADPSSAAAAPCIVVVIAGNPRGVLSSHHEKLLLVDAQCARHAAAFVGGFDIARGRYDQPLHQIPLPYFELSRPHGPAPPRYTGPEVQPVLRRIRFLWHDVQLELAGPCVQQLHLHFAQRWRHAFGCGVGAPEAPPMLAQCRRPGPAPAPAPAPGCTVELVRCWRGVLADVQRLFEAHRHMLRRARRSLYIEHQYPFHNWALTYELCQALRANPQLRVLIVTAVKTDLPSGIVGEMVNWSQDHITQHLLHVHSVAPERVAVYGLCRQDDYRARIKPIYVHSKLCVVDDELLFTGSANMDDMSFFFSSEINLNVYDAALAKGTRLRLCSEHLGSQCPDSFEATFAAFEDKGRQNLEALQAGRGLAGRPVFMAPKERLDLLLSRVYYPSKLSKALYKVGVDTEDWLHLLMHRLPLPRFLRSKL